MGNCAFDGCNRPPFNEFCKYHQYMLYRKGARLYKPKTRKSKPKPESDKRKKEHIRYLDQIQMFAQEHRDNGTFYCFISEEPFDKTNDGHWTIHHLRGRTGDYYLDKEYWILTRQDRHDEVFHGRKTYQQLCVQPWWSKFLIKLKAKDEQSYNKIMRMADKAQPLNRKIWEEEDFD